jgi:hypothetical protein
MQFFAILNILPSICVKYLVAQDISRIPNKILKKIMVLVYVGIVILGSHYDVIGVAITFVLSAVYGTITSTIIDRVLIKNI